MGTGLSFGGGLQFGADWMGFMGLCESSPLGAAFLDVESSWSQQYALKFEAADWLRHQDTAWQTELAQKN